MDKVYIVTYERYDHFRILEVFKTEELALKYLGSLTVSDMIDDGYNSESFYIIEKILWGEL